MSAPSWASAMGWRELASRPKGTHGGLDFLRATAILLVFSGHFAADFVAAGGGAGTWSKLPFFNLGWTGVDLFFVLSGYLIGRQLWKELKETGRLRIGRFLLRRGLRIWPLYFAALAFLVLVLGRHGGSLFRFLPDLAFVSNYLPGILSGGWSLSTEEQFYVIVPVLLLLVHRAVPAGHRWLAPGFLLLVPPLLRWLSDASRDELYTPIHTHCDGLLVGLLLAGASVRFPGAFAERKLSRNLALPGLAALLGLALWALDRRVFAFSSLGIIYGAIALFLLRDGSRLKRVLGWHGFHLVSRLSYGMYLNHFEILPRVLGWLEPLLESALGQGAHVAVIAFALCLAGSISAAAMTFVLIEHPFLVLRDQGLRYRGRVVKLTWKGLGKAACLVAGLSALNGCLGKSGSAEAARAPGTATLQAVSHGEKPLSKKQPAGEPRLALKGSRGETLNFQLLVPPGECKPLTLAGLKSPVEIRVYEMVSIATPNPSFPGAPKATELDPLLPLDLKSVCPASAPLTWLWGELEIPASTPPGDYKGELRFGESAIPFALTVWKMKIPEQHALPAYTGLSSWYATLGHHGEWKPGEEVLARKYFDEALRHRFVPLQNYVARPELIRNGENPRLELRSKPTPDQSFMSVVLKGRPRWAYYDFPTVSPPEISKPETVEYFKAIQNTLKETGRPDRAIVYLWDEPTPDAFASLVKLARIAKTNAPGLKILVTTTPKPELDPYVDIYVPVMDQFAAKGFPDLATYEKLRKQGKEIWWYVSCMSHGCDYLSDSGRPDFVIERGAAWMRSVPWISSKYPIDAFLYYTLLEGYRHHPKQDPWKDPWLFSGNGDGTLMYPGRTGERGFKTETPVASIRLKLWREASFDAEYIRWMSQLKTKPDWWSSELAKLVKSTTDWEKDYVKYQTLRDRAGEYLNQQK
jgi:peptidoglycan/LPS O-acetylase OafA/YrhL